MTDGDAGDDGVFAFFSNYLESNVQVRIEDGHVREVTFPETPSDGAEGTHPLLDRIERYLTGTVRDDFDDVHVSIDVPPEMAGVLDAVRAIPYGHALSVAELLRETDGLDSTDEAHHDRVREALDANPAPLIIPDHRVRDGPSGAPPAIEQRLRSLERNVA